MFLCVKMKRIILKLQWKTLKIPQSTVLALTINVKIEHHRHKQQLSAGVTFGIFLFFTLISLYCW